MVQWLKNNKIQDRIFDVTWFFVVAVALLRLSAWYPLDETLRLEHVMLLIEYICCALCLVIILLNFICRCYSWKIIIACGILALIFGLTAYLADNTYMILYFLVFGASYGQDSRRIITISAFVTAVMTFLLVVLSLAGLAPDPVWYRFFDDGTWLVREGLGFHYSSTGPTVFLGFVFQYIYLRKERLKFWEPLILEAIQGFLFWKTDARMPFYLGTVVLALFFTESLFKNHWRAAGKVNALWIAAPAVIGAGTVASYLLYDANSPVWQRINSILTNRLSLGSAAVQTYGINLFGHDITWVGSSLVEEELAYNYVDSSYIQIMLSEGVLFLAAMIVLFVIIAVKAVKIKDYCLLIIVLFISLYAVMEPYLISFAATPLILLAFARLNREPVVYEKGMLKTIWSY